MLKRLLISAAVILLLSSGAFANIGHVRCFPIGTATTINQAEDFSIGASNMVRRTGGDATAKGGNTVTVSHGLETQARGTTATQYETGTLTQKGCVVGFCGATKVLQDASIEGLQGQEVKGGGHRPAMREQWQGLTVGLDNLVRKSSGVGRASGEQGFVSEQYENITGPGGSSTSYQTVDILQEASVKGGPCSTVVVNNTVDVDMGQWQKVEEVPASPKPGPVYPPHYGHR